MGTRSLTYVYENEAPIICMYRQFDGYPSGHGIGSLVHQSCSVLQMAWDVWLLK